MSIIGLSSPAHMNTEESVNHFTISGVTYFYDEHTTKVNGNGFDLYVRGNIVMEPHQHDHKSILDALKQASGTFCFILTMHEGSVFVGTDAMGFFPLFYTLPSRSKEKGVGFNFANFLPHLKHQVSGLTIDFDFWQMKLHHDDVIGERTPFKEVKRLRQGSVLCLDPTGNVSVEEFDFIEHKERVDIETYIRESNEHLTKSVKELTQNNRDNLVPITGGDDSRRIAVACNNEEIPFRSLTQTTIDRTGYNIDGEIGRRVARALGVEDHKVLPFPDRESYNRQMLAKDYWSGFETTTHDWSGNMTENLGDKALIFDGIVGDITINQHIYRKGFPNNCDLSLEAAYDYLLVKKPISIKKKYLSKNPFELFKSEAGRFIDSGNNTYNLFVTFNHTRRNITHWFTQALLIGHDVALPYAEKEFFEQQLTMQDEDRLKVFCQRECTIRVDKEAGEISSTRDNITKAQAKEMCSEETPSLEVAFLVDKMPINPRVWKYVERSTKEKVRHFICSRIRGQRHFDDRAWYYLPIMKFSAFLDWVETDESSLPILHRGKIPFIDDRS